MLVERTDFEPLIPHAGTMCLLERVLRWDADSILCTAVNHRDADHPLRDAHGLRAIHGIEYGAQAMAIHGALLAREADRQLAAGLLASVRNVRLHVDRLDASQARLEVAAVRQFADGGNMIYTFELAAAGSVLISGQATVVGQGAANS